ncbi:hypothetical protein THASP1DRAFT_32227 [Thamnocephalis sphaerospora]|uniref:Pentacotripeptide-repeat region of PRORP domain-containing protein n=1 Tax=Thamnocephalis sphaerospora TaxID=78915 RepID=A0A4P9XJK7_9FUNG|nr:hypothetical protein THASP1DRAFT_32227 [Thamnocephalis sphaerospora]|eukprot:RKP05945.1 hypothetical protein THASP1DRAFT_32227 [Thamnocephalis sphaerospora]
MASRPAQPTKQKSMPSSRSQPTTEQQKSSKAVINTAPSKTAARETADAKLWMKRPTKKHAKAIHRLEIATQQHDVLDAWAMIQTMANDGVLSQLPPAQLGHVFDMLMALQSPVLDDFLQLIRTQGARLPTPRMYARWMRYEADSGRMDGAFNIYWHYRPIALTEGGKPMVHEIVDLICNRGAQVTTSPMMRFAQDLVEANKPWLVAYYEPLMYEASRRYPDGMMKLYIKMAASGYAPPPEVQARLCSGAVQTSDDLATVRTLYASTYAAGGEMTPVTLKKMMGSLVGSSWNAALAIPENRTLCLDRLEYALEVFRKESRRGNIAGPAQRGLLIQRLVAMELYDEAEQFYRTCVRLAGRCAFVDSGYGLILYKRREYKLLEPLVKEVFAYSFRSLPDGRVVGAKDEEIVLTNPLVARLIAVDGSARAAVKDDDTAIVIRSKLSNGEANDMPGRLSFWPFASLVKILISGSRKDANYVAAMDAYRLFRSVGFVDIEVYENMLWAMQEADDMTGMNTILDDMKCTDTPLPIVASQALIEMHLQRDDLASAGRALDAYIKTHPRTRKYDTLVGSPDAGILFSPVMARYAEAGNLDKVKQLFKVGCSFTNIPKTHLANALFVACGVRESVDELLEMAAYAEKQGVVFTTGNYATIIDILAKRDEYEVAREWYERTVAEGIEMDAFLFCSMMQVYSYAGRPAEAKTFYRRERCKHGIAINQAVLSVLCDTAGYHMTIKDLEGFWQDAQCDGVQPDENNYAALAEAYWRLGDMDKATKVLLQDMPQAGYAPNYNMLRTVHYHAGKNGRKDIITQLQPALAKHRQNNQHVEQPVQP